MSAREKPAGKVLLLGAGGHAKGIIEALRQAHPDLTLAALDQAAARDGSVLGVPVIGGDDVLDSAAENGFRYFVVALGGTGDNRPRARLFEHARRSGLLPLSVLHPSAILAGSARLGLGVQALFGAVVGADAALGMDVIVNSGAVIEHDCEIGDHAHVASGATLAGAVRIGAYAHVGAGAVVLQGMTVGEFAIIGAGSVVTRPVPDHAVVWGVPAQIHRFAEA